MHARATAFDRLGAQLVVPGLVAVDPAQPIPGAVLGQPRRGSEVLDVDRVPRHVSRRLRGGHPPGGFLFGSVLGNRLTQKLILVLRGTPAAVDVEHDPVARGSSCSPAHGVEQSRVKVGDTWNLVIEDRRPAGNGTGSLTERTSVLDAKQPMAEDCGNDDQQADDEQEPIVDTAGDVLVDANRRVVQYWLHHARQGTRLEEALPRVRDAWFRSVEHAHAQPAQELPPAHAVVAAASGEAVAPRWTASAASMLDATSSGCATAVSP